MNILQILRKKRSGSTMFLYLVMVCLMMAIVTPAQVDSVSAMFSAYDANRTGTTTFNLAEAKVNTLKATPYSSLAAEVRAAIPSAAPYEREVVLGPEVDLGGGNKERTATVNIYKTGETQPRETQILTLPSQGSSSGVPVGMVLYFATSVPPSGYLECDGSILDPVTYPVLTALLGTTYGAYGQLPDLRGEFIRGWIHNRINVPGESGIRIFGSTQIDAFKNHAHLSNPDTLGYAGNNYFSREMASLQGGGLGYNPGGIGRAGFSILPSVTSSIGDTNETRPRNIALLPCIRAIP